jgi:hypothetical protein
MEEFRDLYGAVYILENSVAKRVKVGMTTNSIEGRLKDVNYKWLEVSATCQICGGRRMVDSSGYIPQHVLSGVRCLGSDALPLERGYELSQTYLLNLRASVHELTGSEKGSAVRRINTLQKRIEFLRNQGQPVGQWEFRTAFYTKSAERVELLAHALLAESLDKLAPFGEVFCCSVSQASDAVEAALSQLGLSQSARRSSFA